MNLHLTGGFMVYAGIIANDKHTEVTTRFVDAGSIRRTTPTWLSHQTNSANYIVMIPLGREYDLSVTVRTSWEELENGYMRKKIVVVPHLDITNLKDREALPDVRILDNQLDLE